MRSARSVTGSQISYRPEISWEIFPFTVDVICIGGYSSIVTETLTSLSSSALDEVFAAGVAGSGVVTSVTLADVLEAVGGEFWLSCQRVANAVEMAACANCCSECGAALVAKVGGGTVQGTVIGYRSGRDEEFAWTGVLCRSCEIAAAIADGLA